MMRMIGAAAAERASGKPYSGNRWPRERRGKRREATDPALILTLTKYLVVYWVYSEYEPTVRRKGERVAVSQSVSQFPSHDFL